MVWYIHILCHVRAVCHWHDDILPINKCLSSLTQTLDFSIKFIVATERCLCLSLAHSLALPRAYVFVILFVCLYLVLFKIDLIIVANENYWSTTLSQHGNYIHINIVVNIYKLFWLFVCLACAPVRAGTKHTHSCCYCLESEEKSCVKFIRVAVLSSKW